MTCPCCGWEYTIGRGDWQHHNCSGFGRGPSHDWYQQWCHLDASVNGVKAKPRDGACGKCLLHCRCASRQRNNLPHMEPNEGIQQFIFRMQNARVREWSPHNSE